MSTRMPARGKQAVSANCAISGCLQNSGPFAQNVHRRCRKWTVWLPAPRADRHRPAGRHARLWRQASTGVFVAVLQVLPFSRPPSAKSRALPGPRRPRSAVFCRLGESLALPRPVRLTGRWPKSLVAPSGAFSEACAGRERLRLNRPRRGPAPVGCAGETAPRRFRSRRAGRPRAVGAESLPDSCPAHRPPPLPAVAIPCAGAIR